MSYEAWGTPPDPAPTYCPVCGDDRHDANSACEMAVMHRRAVAAEAELPLAISYFKQAEARVDDVRRLTVAAVAPAKWENNDYGRGLANGLLLALSTLRDAGFEPLTPGKRTLVNELRQAWRRYRGLA